MQPLRKKYALIDYNKNILFPKSKLESVAEMLRGLGATDVLTLGLDMSKEDECVAAVKRTVDHFGSEKGSIRICRASFGDNSDT